MNTKDIIQKYKDGVITFSEALNYVDETKEHHFIKLKAKLLIKAMPYQVIGDSVISR